MSKLLSLYGLKFHPFRPDVLFTTPAVDSFVRRIELGIADGGFAMLTGDPGTGKSIALRLLAERLAERRSRRRIRIASTLPSCDLGTPMASPDNVARAAASASAASDLPWRRRA
ncbi:MAG TPA: hypothetical protein VGL81_04450 [Polyangiaceae bacterium]|jgi:type II secretory pathway predicted ATPase ExeA